MKTWDVKKTEEDRRREIRARAAELFATDECQIDDDAQVSEADEGVWIAAWLWLPEEDSE
jgi:hypothetical protein